MLAEGLEDAGLAVAESPDVADARARLEGFAYDALVVDLTLPDGDGMQLLREALERYPAIRAIVVTGFGGIEEAVKAIRMGAVDFLIKPFQLAQLSRSLQQALELGKKKPDEADDQLDELEFGIGALERAAELKKLHEKVAAAYGLPHPAVASAKAVFAAFLSASYSCQGKLA